jgi:rare lipoprotein A (peptidoglycan hydrolase)
MQSLGFERDGYAAVRVEVLERDRDDVRAVDLRQSGPATDADALRVCIEVERVSV